MALLDKNGQEMPNSSKNNHPPNEKASFNVVEILAEWMVNIASVPFTFISTLLEQFLTPGSAGTKIIGAIGFMFCSLMSADSIWQCLFQGVPMFPWYEESWIGWIGWVTVPFNLFFWLALSMSALVQIMEARTLRGKRPDQAKVEFEESQQ